MADKVRYILSTKVGKSGVNKGKSEVIVKVYLNRTVRVQLKSGVFVYPKYFGDSEEGIIVPKHSKLNFAERNETINAKRELDEYVKRITMVISAIGGPGCILADA